MNAACFLMLEVVIMAVEIKMHPMAFQKRQQPVDQLGCVTMLA
jgi:hypothetical protein